MENYENFLEELVRLTKLNHASEARLLIAKYFELDYYVSIFQAIKDICDAECCLPAEISTFSLRMTDNLIESIAWLKGFKIANEIKSKI